MHWLGFKEVLAPMGKGAAGEVGKVLGGALGAALLAWLLTFLPPIKAILDTPLAMRWSTFLVACVVLVLASAIGVYFAMRRRIATLTRAAAMDFALGIYNARECEERMSQMLKLYTRDKQFLCTFVLLDLDRFKEINDSHGYAGGDAILKQFVDVMRRCTRESDVICRFRSGDEFLVILPQALLAGGVTVAERIRERTERFAFQTVSKGKTVRMTVSAGVFCIDIAPEPPTIEHVKERLEEYLQVAKLKKNRVVDREVDDLPLLNIE